MMGLFADAYANARLRARKSRLRGPEDLRVLRAAPSASALATALQADPLRDAGRLPAFLFAALVADYARILQDYPRGAPLWRALLGLHEIENLKLAWRARSRSLPASRWTSLWRPLGALESLHLADWSGAGSLRDAARHLAGPYAEIVAAVLEAHESDLAAAELALDRWAWARLAEEARSLPRAEAVAADLIAALVRERDYDLLRRSVASGRMPADAAVAATALLRFEENAQALRSLAAWTPDAGPLGAHLPPRLAERLKPVPDWNAFARALARERREKCRRALRGYPFRLAPAAAFLLLREEEVRGLSAVARSARTTDAAPPALSRALAASAMEP